MRDAPTMRVMVEALISTFNANSLNMRTPPVILIVP